jgi:hypothetical protein
MDYGIDDKIRENRLRRMADRQGLILRKSRARDERSLTYGCYQLVDQQVGGSVVNDPLGRGYPLHSLDDVEEWLTTPPSVPDPIAISAVRRAPVNPRGGRGTTA